MDFMTQNCFDEFHDTYYNLFFGVIVITLDIDLADTEKFPIISYMPAFCKSCMAFMCISLANTIIRRRVGKHAFLSFFCRVHIINVQSHRSKILEQNIMHDLPVLRFNQGHLKIVSKEVNVRIQ